MHQDVGVAADGGGEVGVQRHVESVVVVQQLVRQHAAAEILGVLHRHTTCAQLKKKKKSIYAYSRPCTAKRMHLQRDARQKCYLLLLLLLFRSYM